MLSEPSLSKVSRPPSQISHVVEVLGMKKEQNQLHLIMIGKLKMGEI